MLSSNDLSVLLQCINITVLLTGLLLILKRWMKCKLLIFVFFLGELLFELSDFVERCMGFNSSNTFYYPFNQFFIIVVITSIYDYYLFKIPYIQKVLIFNLALVMLGINIYTFPENHKITFYFNLVNNLVICYFSGNYFLKVITKTKVEVSSFILNAFVFLYFSIECIISVTFNFLISNDLKWVAPIWIFRGVLLLMFYLTFINLVWKIGQTKI